jgi:deazaflavin-dependent oxidoreductase (nitroreductase family)
MGWYADAIKRLGHRRWFAALASRVGPRVDRTLYKLTGGRITSTGTPVIPTLLLTTTGRTSGLPRTTPLLFVRNGSDFVVAGSNWGQPDDPNWAKNLLSDPHASVQIGRRTIRVTARAAHGDEATRLWRALDEAWPAYDAYRKRSGREIRVFVLEPVA